MFDTILTYFRYILSYLWLYLANSKGTKNIDKDIYIIIINIKSIYIKNTYISNIYTIDIWIRYFSIKAIYIKDIYIKNTSIRGIKIKILVK